MPSSSSPAQQSARQAPAMPDQKQQEDEYRQTTYHNGRSIQIEESRRRSWAVRKVDSPVQTYADFVLYPVENERTSPRSKLQQVELPHPAPREVAAGPACVEKKREASRPSWGGKVESRIVGGVEVGFTLLCWSNASSYA
ncbi:hypothetical protein J4E85_011194 [Alternaria conjuncta]|uniref:uncharacterized protein n=1 Tax=Alternaria conjuncta TaxID=181017 RepID=UPI002220E29A|nr:uncharacterized protein J4E85_011194 [Alternaria conjuncta]KAI4911525.1 hypothetical protein J4E85_011194 [Alternaria conjuncta]